MKRACYGVLLALGVVSSCKEDDFGATKLSGQIAADRTLSGEVGLTGTTTVAPGVTLTLAAGTTIRAADGAALEVEGSLIAEGTPGDEVDLSGLDDDPGSWAGVVAKQGGSVDLRWTAVHAAQVAFKAERGSTYALDRLVIDTSSSLLALASDGTISHGTLHGLGDDQTETPISIESASPSFSDTLIDRTNDEVDDVVVGGASSSPSFDHVEITGCHCAFHFNQGSGIAIESSYIHGNKYAMMVVNALETTVQDSNLEENKVNIGICQGGSVEATGVHFTGGPFDASCLGQGNTTPAESHLPNSKPRP